MMRRKFLAIVGLVVVVSSLIFSVQAFAWSIKGGSVICDGFWKGNIDPNAATTCAIQGSVDVYVWCSNSNNAGQVSPPKLVLDSGLVGTSPNFYGHREKGKVSLTVTINSESSIDPAICAQGNSKPNQSGQWRVVKVLPSGPFTAVVSTLQNNGATTSETLSCSGLINNGNPLSAYVNTITGILQTGNPDLSSLNLVYDCTTVSSN
jgi:hypothetical protein